MKKTKCLVMFSGGLDSRLVVKILQEQAIDVETIFVNLPFGGGCCNNTECIFNFVQMQGVKLHIIDCTKSPYFEEYLEIIKHPKHGRGVALNPCKDCKIFIFKKAKEVAEKINADFLATGEVLGERPFSQYKSSLLLIEKKADLEGKVLRPLSAKLLPITIPEKNNLVDREKLLGIQGRQRKKQIELAKKYNIKYPSPGGGCLLCEKYYCKKLSEFLKENKNFSYEELLLMRIGRHFKNKGKIILGKREKENNQIEEINKTLKWNIIIPDKIPGPTAIFENSEDKSFVEDLIKEYSKKKS